MENGRHTELAVAVEVLERLNDGNGDSINRLLNRRLGRGGLIAGRLLQEGVLEQDKRVRLQFRKCLEPVGAFVDIASLLSFTEVSQLNSCSWLLTFLIELLKEADQTENIGAAILLTYLLPDDDYEN